MFIGAICIVYAADREIASSCMEKMMLFCKLMCANIGKWVISFGTIGAMLGFICSFLK